MSSFEKTKRKEGKEGKEDRGLKKKIWNRRSGRWREERWLELVFRRRRQVEEGAYDLHGRAIGAVGGRIRATTVHGRAGEALPGARTQADRGSGEGLVPESADQVAEAPPRAAEPEGARVPAYPQLVPGARGQQRGRQMVKRVRVPRS